MLKQFVIYIHFLILVPGSGFTTPLNKDPIQIRSHNPDIFLVQSVQTEKNAALTDSLDSIQSKLSDTYLYYLGDDPLRAR
jgi:hypothetical protein